MKVSDLVNYLKTFPQDLEVLTAKDDEGNGFRRIPDGWCSVEKFDEDFEIIAQEDYDEYDDLKDYVVIG